MLKRVENDLSTMTQMSAEHSASEDDVVTQRKSPKAREMKMKMKVDEKNKKNKKNRKVMKPEREAKKRDRER